MKTKVPLHALLVLLSFTTVGFCQSDAPSPSNHSKWYLSEGWGITCPVQDWALDYPLGGQALLAGGCQLDNSFSLQLSLNPALFTGGGSATVDTRLSLELRWRNSAEGVHPYILAGPGYDVQVQSPSGYSTSSPAAVFGVGFEFDLHPGEHLFLESRYDLLFYKNLTQQDVPLTLGLSEDL
ncbi:MAG TPA: hypothetical protein VHE12_01190 [bacterium]|nr:hypothetical protein [bacterium]